ncbi:MAG: hypothetical protein LBP40_03935, partial [Campylobacteraceae bacterium]|nr:hypothetical protein [Campylobacteraceae bacterium]
GIYNFKGLTVKIEKKGLQFTCDRLYIGGEVSRDKYTEVTISGDNKFSGTDFAVNKHNQNPTLAIGPYNGKVTFYWWDYDMTKSTGSGNEAIYYMQDGDASTSTISQTPPSINFGGSRVSGGTVNQKTGEIYLLSEPDTANSRVMSVLKPDSNGVFSLTKQSNRLGFTNSQNKHAYASDMAIDADGNAYLLVNTVLSHGSDYSDTYKLVKVNPNDWSYNDVRAPNIQLTNRQLWGMAFLNGKLYVSSDSHPIATMYAVDPIKGVKSAEGSVIMMGTGREYRYGIDDVASCQTAAAITGRVYLDKDGDGKINNQDKTSGKYQFIPNVVVEIYDSLTGAPLGWQYTNDIGEYSFLVEIPKTYYIRLRQPQINGANTRQTWASGGEFRWESSIEGYRSGTNYVIPTCYNNATKIDDPANKQKQWYSGTETIKRYSQACYGTKADGIDKSANGITNIANYATTVIMQTDLSVAHADFALSAVDRGDAPLSFGDASGYASPDGVKIGNLRDNDMKSLASINADGDDKDSQNDEDGVEVKADNNKSAVWEKLTNFKFNNVEGKYLFRVKANKGGYLSAWINMNKNAVNLDNFNDGTKIANAIPYNANNDTGYITFKAEVNTKIAADGGFVDGVKVSKLKDVYFRFRYTTNNASIGAADIKRGGAEANSIPWAIEGESEDYKANYQFIEEPQEPKGSLIIVNKNFDAAKDGKKKIDASDAVFALYTQISNKPFEVQMVYYDESGNGIASNIVNPPISVNVDLVDFNGDCETSSVIQNSIYSGNLTEVSKKLSNIKIARAVKNGVFRITYKYENSQSKKVSCSPDSFAVRPAEFRLEDNLSGNLIGGSIQKSSFKAVNYAGTNSAYGYNQTSANIIISNVTLDKSALCTLESDASGEFDMSANNFKNGVSNINLTYHNVGKINISLKDNEWTNIDSAKGDCLSGSADNKPDLHGKVGCDIQMNQGMRFVPKNFHINMAVYNANNNFTYLSNSSIMSAIVKTSVQAKLSDNTTAANYHKNCFADNVSFTFSLLNNNITGWDGREGKTPKERIVFFQKESGKLLKNNADKDGTGVFEIKQESFKNGEADDVQFGFNFGRIVKDAENPFKLNSSLDFNITHMRDTSVSEAAINIANSDMVFFYGRAFSKNYEGESPINAKIQYEIYCLGCVRNDYGISLVSINLE